MNFKFTGRKVEITDEIKSYGEKKIGKLSKFFSSDAEAAVICSVSKDKHRVEVTIYSHNMIYRADQTTASMYSSFDGIIDVLERQIRKHKTKLERRLRDSSFTKATKEEEWESVPEDEREFEIVRTKIHAIKPMSPEEAILQMDLLGHGFYLFRDDQSGKTCIVYGRKQGNYGLIQAE